IEPGEQGTGERSVADQDRGRMPLQVVEQPRLVAGVEVVRGVESDEATRGKPVAERVDPVDRAPDEDALLRRDPAGESPNVDGTAHVAGEDAVVRSLVDCSEQPAPRGRVVPPNRGGLELVP